MTSFDAETPYYERPERVRDFRLRDWWRVAKGVVRETGENELTLIAAGVAFYGFLAIFPLLAALVAFYGFLADPVEVERQLAAAAEWAPPGAYQVVEGQIQEITSAGRTRLGYASLLSLVLTLWTARAGTGALIRGLNIVYRVPEKRGFLSGTALAYAMTLAIVLVALVALIAVVILPGVLAAFPVGELTGMAVAYGRWPIVFGALILALGLLYRFGPDEPRPHFAWLSVGAVTAILLWIAGSAAFSYYVSHFASYNETYGSLGAIVGLLMWIYLSALVILLGAEINAQVEFRLYGRPEERDPDLRRRWSSVSGLLRGRAAGAGGAGWWSAGGPD
jgi:membrane protein